MDEEKRLKRNAYMREWNEKNREKVRSRYAQYKANYKANGIVSEIKNTNEELWNRIEKRGPNECWPWLGWINGGYGRVQIGFETFYAHRVIFDIVNPGVISRRGPKTQNDYGFLLHKCNNRICCNPNHLYVGTHKDNMQDRLKNGDGYKNLPKGEKHHASVLSDSDRAELINVHKVHGLCAQELALRFNVNRNTVKSILYRHKRKGGQ